MPLANAVFVCIRMFHVERLCYGIAQNGNTANVGSYLASPDCRFREFRSKDHVEPAGHIMGPWLYRAIRLCVHALCQLHTVSDGTVSRTATVS